MDAKFSYREAAVRGASPVQLVICLYEQAIEDLRRASVALKKRDTEARTRAINHALQVIAQLQGSLDMERGSEVARNLHRFYNTVRTGLLQAQFRQSAEILDQQIGQLVLVRDAWLEVERAMAGPAPAAVEPLPPNPAMPASEAPIADWNA